MQIHGMPNVAAGAAIPSNPGVVGTITARVNTEQSFPEDQVTLSQAAKQMSTGNPPYLNTNNTMNDIIGAESAISSGTYTVIATALSGHLAIVLIE